MNHENYHVLYAAIVHPGLSGCFAASTERGSAQSQAAGGKRAGEELRQEDQGQREDQEAGGEKSHGGTASGRAGCLSGSGAQGVGGSLPS